MVRTIRNRRLRQEVVSFISRYHEELVTSALNHTGDGREAILILVVFVEREGLEGRSQPLIYLAKQIHRCFMNLSKVPSKVVLFVG